MVSKKHSKSRCTSPGSQDFPEHAERMRDFRLAHNGTESIATGGNFNPFRRLGLIPPRGIALRLRNALN